MADDKGKQAPQDSNRINLSEEELSYWTSELGVTEEMLRDLVEVHGHSPQKIREVLDKAA